MQNLLEQLKTTLQTDERFIIDGKLAKNKIIECALAIDEDLIGLLLENEAIKRHFFKEVKGILIFDKIEFQRFVSNKQFLPDSYTAFKNKIGLTANNEYLTESKEVVLVWPYKDCVLEGGQTKEEQKRKEIFWNQTLASDEIDRLLAPKVLTNFKKYDRNGEHSVDNISLNDNLIIKGNNLLALHSLKKQYAGKVKLIYIDPPYNTGSDSFGYNDSFNHSTWLTFMKNRLEVAKRLLRDDGVLLVQINDHNQSYLKNLLDELFNKENFINLISVRTKSPSGFKTVNLGLFETAEYILMYGKNKNQFQYKTQYIYSGYDENYTGHIKNISSPVDKWEVGDIRDIICNQEGIDKEIEKQPYSKVKNKIGEDLYLQKLAKLALDNCESVFRLTAIGYDAGKETLIIKDKSLANPNKVYIAKKDNENERYIFNGQEITFYSKKVREIDGIKVPTTLLTNIWTDIAWEGIASEGGVKLKKGKKPEKLLRRIIDMTSSAGDIILDFHLGSGTTCAVAHKMKRRYIGIEQLDYDDNDSIVRLNNVINGDQTGVSKSISWQGGGSFVYCELKQHNANVIDKIEQANTPEQLTAIWHEIENADFISYQIKPELINANIHEFESLSIDEQKQFLIEVLDKNQLYVNYSEIDDADYQISAEDKKLNKQFYGEV